MQPHILGKRPRAIATVGCIRMLIVREFLFGGERKPGQIFERANLVEGNAFVLPPVEIIRRHPFEQRSKPGELVGSQVGNRGEFGHRARLAGKTKPPAESTTGSGEPNRKPYERGPSKS